MIKYRVEGNKIIRSKNGKSQEFELGRRVKGKDITYFVKPDFQRGGRHYHTRAKFLDGHYVLFHSEGMDDDVMFGVECAENVKRAEQRLKEEMCQVLEERLEDAMVPSYIQG